MEILRGRQAVLWLWVTKHSQAFFERSTAVLLMNNAASKWTWWSGLPFAPNPCPTTHPRALSAVWARGLCLPPLFPTFQTRLDWFESSGAHQPRGVYPLLCTCSGQPRHLCQRQMWHVMVQHFNVRTFLHFLPGEGGGVKKCCSAYLGRCWRCTLTLGCPSDSFLTGGLAPGSASSWTISTKIENTNIEVRWCVKGNAFSLYHFPVVSPQWKWGISCYFQLD